MDIILILVPLALCLGGAGLVAFIWSMKNGQFDDPEGNAARILEDDSFPKQEPRITAGKNAAEKEIR